VKIDWLAKLRFFLQTMAFCLAISAIQYAFQPGRPYEVPLVYSICIGTGCWAVIDFGRHLFASSAETGWPQGLARVSLPVVGTVCGYFIGTLAGDWWFGWSSWDVGGRAQLPVSILITALAGLTGSYYFYSRTRHGYLETRMSEARRQASEAKLKLLETQLEPHMLFNSLANLRVLISADAPRAQAMLDHMIAYLRATLNASRASSHTLQAEFDRLHDYLELMAVRMGSRLTYQLELPPELATHAVPTLLLQPLVENAIKHGLEPKVQGGDIRVRASRDGGLVMLEVVDTGVGISGSGAIGFGLAHVRERLETAYHGRGTCELAPNDTVGTRVRITFPYDA
jgi:hypothetical protein